MIQYSGKGRHSRILRLFLKAPAHLWGLDALAATFPDVAIVWSHRDPVACTASVCSMTAALMTTLEGLDKRWLGPRVLDFYASSLDRELTDEELAVAKPLFAKVKA